MGMDATAYVLYKLDGLAFKLLTKEAFVHKTHLALLRLSVILEMSELRVRYMSELRYRIFPLPFEQVIALYAAILYR